MLDLDAVDLVLHIDVPDEVIAERMVNRRVHEARHAIACPRSWKFVVLVPAAHPCTVLNRVSLECTH